jgi:hypothetical protein
MRQSRQLRDIGKLLVLRRLPETRMIQAVRGFSDLQRQRQGGVLRAILGLMLANSRQTLRL